MHICIHAYTHEPVYINIYYTYTVKLFWHSPGMEAELLDARMG